MEPFTVRASELGGCLRAHVCRKLGYKPSLAPEKFREEYFPRGIAHEASVLGRMAKEGWNITGWQKEVHLSTTASDGTELQVVGHLDALGRMRRSDAVGALGYGAPRVIEAKSPGAYEAFVHQWSLGRPIDEWGPLEQRYAWQVSVYMLAEGRSGLLVCLDDDALKTCFVPRPLISRAQIDDRLRTIWEATDLPSCDRRDYPCPFYPFHEPEPAPAFHDSDDIADLVDQVLAAQGEKRHFEDLEKAARERLRVVLGDDPGEWATPTGEVSLYVVSNRRTYDHAAMVADGIDLERYTKVEPPALRMRVQPRKESSRPRFGRTE